MHDFLYKDGENLFFTQLYIFKCLKMNCDRCDNAFVVIFFKTMYYKTIIRFGFCDIRISEFDELCAFLKRGRNSTYLWGLQRRRGHCVFKIWMSRLPERTKKNQHVQFLRHHCNRAVFPSYSRVSQIKVNEGNQNRGDKFKSSRRYLVRDLSEISRGEGEF